MGSNKFLRVARQVVERDKELFDALLEFEKTKKIKSKTRVNFTIDKSIASRFRKLCRDKGYNMSSKIEKAMEKMVEKG